MIKIFISDYAESVHVSEKTLIGVLAWFVTVFRYKHCGSKPGMLRFPEDDLNMWKWLLFWIFHNIIMNGFQMAEIAIARHFTSFTVGA